MIYASLFGAVTAAGAYIMIPLPPVPITLQTAFLSLAAALLGGRLGALSQVVYILIGIIGLPVFAGGKAGLSVKPGTPIEPYLEILKNFDTLLIMSVEPGFGGQAFMPEVLSKARAVRKLVDSGELKLVIEIDGGIAESTIEQAAEAGVDCFVAGSAVYGAADPGEAVRKLRALAAKAG